MGHHRLVGLCVWAMLGLHGFCADAQQTVCTTSLGDVRVRGDLTIAARCQLTGTDVRGNVILFEGGSLVARDVRIRGNLEGSRADFVDIERSRIDGAIGLQGLVGDESRIERSDVRGDTALTANRSAFEILNNEFRRTLRVLGNTGGVSISGNAIDRNLECSDNRPAPVGVANRIDGEARGQCASLRADAAPPPSPTPPTAAPTPAPPPITPAPPPTVTPPPPRTPAPPSTPTPMPPRTPTTPSTPLPPPTATPSPAPSSPPASPAPPPPAASPPAAVTPAAPAPPTTPPTEPDPSIADEGGAGAMGLSALLLLPLLAWRRFARRKHAAGTPRARD